MPDRKRTSDQRSTEDILREMEELSKSIDSTLSDISPDKSERAEAAPPPTRRSGGAMKSLLNFFVSVEPDESEADEAAPPADEAADAPPASPSSTSAPSGARATGPRVADLVAGEAPPTFDPHAADPSADLSAKPLEEIYAEAGLGDSQCSVDDLAKLMQNPAIVNQPLSVKVVAVNLALSAKGVGADVPVADAVRRDRALDAFQSMLDLRARAAEQRNASEIERLTKEAEEYLKRKQVEMESLRAETAEAKRQAVEFAQRRETEERRLADLVSPFLEGKPSPVTVGNKGADDAPQT